MQEIKTTPEEIWAILQEVSKKQAETSQNIAVLFQSMQETDRQLKETDRQLKETDKKIKETIQETDRQLKESFQETDKRLEENFERTSKEIRAFRGEYTAHWGTLLESMVEGKVVELFQSVGIEVTDTDRNIENEKGSAINSEHDIIAKNRTVVVVIEVKTTLRVKHVNHFLRSLELFKSRYEKYSGKKVYGALAYLAVVERADKYAERKGLYVIKAVGDSAMMMNRTGFKGKLFGEKP